ncbi:hypothetical protein CDL15_Pgr023309 [Punica granatum]|uniref:non-specific serine/threonine protein kinase n=2 Tax=Punica granatum TaxID=22663 RepID=A0A218Y271_PUNGR|nr:hypothetical protein CDL15_Pgr023309 [Punica granatum]
MKTRAQTSIGPTMISSSQAEFYMLNPMFKSLLLSCFLLLLLPLCSCRDHITLEHPIRDIPGDTLVSEGKTFELGFFTPGGSSDPGRRYIGIWYHGSNPPTVVWVANRTNPVSNGTGIFHIVDDGNLVVSTRDNNKSQWTTALGVPSNSRSIVVKLMDSGNLILSNVSGDGKPTTLWQSFDYPTDTFLPGMKMDEGLHLTSWKKEDDPARGFYVFQLDPDVRHHYMIKNQSSPYWKSATYRTYSSDWFLVVTDLLSNSTGSSPERSKYYPKNYSRIRDWRNTRVTLTFDGKVQLLKQDPGKDQWDPKWSEPDRCGVLDVCGNFASCNKENISPCRCLPGFEPKTSYDSPQGLECGSTTPYGDHFLDLMMMKAGNPDDEVAKNASECMEHCRTTPKCRAFSYEENDNERTRESKCWVWSGDIENIQEFTADGRNLSIRVSPENVRGGCGNCGTTIIPYPLSKGQKCGDPSYSGFSCNVSTGQVYFNTSNGPFRVTGINASALSFTIAVNSADYCTRGSSNITLQPGQSSQFRIGRCRSIQDPLLLSTQLTEVLITYSPPREPLCNSNKDCLDFPSSSCDAGYEGANRCRCISRFKWNTTSLNCTSANGDDADNNKLLYLIFTVVVAIILVGMGAFYYTRRMSANEQEQVQRESISGNIALRLYDGEKRVKEWISSSQFGEDDKKRIDVPFFDLEIILEATNNFSDESKLGQGGFGPVYKGKFPGGQEIAVKRLSSGSGQGLEEFKSEVMLIAKLQHRNLVRLLGYCIEGDEKILLYEYMPNKSLDSFIFDRTRCVLLTWQMRLEIILGITRGMLYLHQDSRLRIIHRDLKTSNVLLDEEMNPKISDFGLARIFEGKQIEATTQRVIGTYGYMSPEYALDGFFSIKSDVFSFGVVVLEIISGKRNTGFYQAEGQINLLGHAWRLWTENNALNLMDHVLEETCNGDEVVKCINVALLCLQEDPNDRPTMSNVLFMLGGEITTLPTPKQPAFALKPSLSSTGSSSTRPDSSFIISSSMEQGR